MHRALTDAKETADSWRIEVRPIGQQDHSTLANTEPVNKDANLGVQVMLGQRLVLPRVAFSCSAPSRGTQKHPRFVKHASVEVGPAVPNRGPCTRTDGPKESLLEDVERISRTHESSSET
jgi:hypothetical protein